MDYISILISALAFGLSVFTFYWVQLRVKHKLYLVRIDKLGEFGGPTFALVNSGTRDILITSVEGWFKNTTEGGGFCPTQKVEVGEGSSMLLSAGKAVQCSITFLERFSKEVILKGEPLEGSSPLIYQLEFEIKVSWVDSNAHGHKSSAPIAKYGFHESQDIRHFAPLVAKHDLYRNS